MEAAPIHLDETPVAVSDERPRLRGFALWSVLIALMLTLFLSALDQTIVATALPTILGDLHGFNLYTWVITGYLITSTTMVPIVGKLSDQFGRKWFIVAGVLIFLAGRSPAPRRRWISSSASARCKASVAAC